MDIEGKCVVTTKEALQILGLRIGSLIWLEREAGLRRRPARTGYSHREMRRLWAALKAAVAAGD